jgi:hypothetical protein
MAIKPNESYYLVNFREPKDGKITTLKARTIQDSDLGLSFISISNIFFEENSPVVNPTEEAMKKRFELTKALHLSIYSILSIEEVGSKNRGLKFRKNKSNVIVLSPDAPLS